MGEGDGATRVHWPCVIFILLALVCDIYIYIIYIYILYILYYNIYFILRYLYIYICIKHIYIYYIYCYIYNITSSSPRMQAYDKAVADPEIKNPCKHVESLKLPGFFRCCFYRWKKARNEEKWTLLCKSSPKVAKSCKELPGFLRPTLGKCSKIPKRTPKGQPVGDTTTMLPAELVTAVSDSVAPWVHTDTYIHIYIYMNTYTHTYI